MDAQKLERKPRQGDAWSNSVAQNWPFCVSLIAPRAPELLPRISLKMGTGTGVASQLAALDGSP